MYDLSVPNAKPGRCEKCRGIGRYSWGAVINGKPQHAGRAGRLAKISRGTSPITATRLR